MDVYKNMLSELAEWKPRSAEAKPKNYRESGPDIFGTVGASCEKCYFFTSGYRYKRGYGGCSFYNQPVNSDFLCDDFFSPLSETLE
jgi:hypothetical protein